ncbi:hypothetical protein QYE76_044647 [Lolium multiflorum]|uniref:Integrase catalytic domain-containing protein n=1 Tax=Lolium multiflorum TaxID=4521 RepID=A0AAD8TJ51_LOLMU|nr:hypothetical protein QYE76_044647 [Lolium multiflorum]
MENNLEMAGVEANDKVLFAMHYLAGPARAWWTSARALNAGQMMTWADFKLKFSKYHVPPGLIKKMRDEFRELKQGRMTVVEYRDKFLTLSRTVLVNIPFADLEALVDSAIQMEGKLNQANENRKRRMMHQSGPSNTPKFRPSSSGGFTPRNNRPPAPMSRPGYQNRSGGNPRLEATTTRQQQLRPPQKQLQPCADESSRQHHQQQLLRCPKKLAKLAANTAAPAQQQRRVTNGKKFAPNNPNNRSGRLFHMSAEEAQEAPDVVLDSELKQVILKEAHDTLYSIHPGGTKMYQDLKEQFWWHGMKREIGSYIAKCDICQRVKAEHQRPAGLLQPLQIPEWKWDSVGMDFITGLPKSSKGNDSIWVVVDRLTKVAHFIPVKTTYQGPKLAELYISRIVSLHGTPKSIVSDRGSQFIEIQVHEGLGTRLNFSTAYHPQTDGQTERVNQILEDMLRACVLEYGSKREDYLPYAEFSYNNSYQASLQMAPFEALYGRKCRTPLNWSEVGESQVFGPDILREAEENVHKIRVPQDSQSRQKSYADKRRREKTFEIGDFMYLKVPPLKGMQRFQLRGKLAPRYVGPFKVLSRRGEVSYQLELPEEMAAVHNVFHISLLRKCLEVPKVFKNIDHRSVDINSYLTYREVPIRILEEAFRTTRTRSIKFLKIQWSNHTEEEATWEREDFMKTEYPNLFST